MARTVTSVEVTTNEEYYEYLSVNSCAAFSGVIRIQIDDDTVELIPLHEVKHVRIKTEEV